MILTGGKKLSGRNVKEARKFEIETLEREILHLRVKTREEAMKAYRKLLLSAADEPIYLTRSE